MPVFKYICMDAWKKATLLKKTLNLFFILFSILFPLIFLKIMFDFT